MELHTFSSLNKSFLKEYAGTMDAADVAVVFYSPDTLEHKKLPHISPQEVKDAFQKTDLLVFTQTQDLQDFLNGRSWKKSNLLLMSSGNFRGLEIQGIIDQVMEG
jgi:UDP-N-acetylmuramate: L-alanyl-gamma-D-glutamyl-meso-diaminopimelate ligase